MQFERLAKINDPIDLRDLSRRELENVALELKEFIIQVVEEKGGHFSSPLGVVDLTLALHTVFETPRDLLIWDVGHQCYPHKIITGRRDEFQTLRQMDGISGFCKTSESEYDVFGAGHASTSISAALGMAQARKLKKEKHRIVAVIGDGAMTGGLAFEGLNNVSNLDGQQFLIVLNDNQMSISPTVGAVSHYLTKVVTNPLYNRIKDLIWKATEKLPLGKKYIQRFLHSLQEGLKNFLVPGMIFEELGIRYIGPIDGHDLDEMMDTFENVKDMKKPAVVHVLTRKGSGKEIAEEDPLKYYSVSGNASPNGQQISAGPGYSKVFGSIAREMAESNENVCAVVAAMQEGTGLLEFAQEYPQRFFDVGIAEGHAVTYASGLAAAGMHPVVAIYSTFLQRSFDMVVHDAALQNLPVIFALDRAGLVGPDGPTHHGALDIAYLRCIQNMIVTAPKDGNELRNLLFTALDFSEGPFSVRYPKESVPKFDDGLKPEILPIGSWERISEGSDIAVLAVGSMVNSVTNISGELNKFGISCELVNCRFIKPMDEVYLKSLLDRFDRVLTLEDGVVSGGFGEGVTAWLSEHGYTGKVTCLGHPDTFVEQGTRAELLALTGLDENGILRAVKDLVQITSTISV